MRLSKPKTRKQLRTEVQEAQAKLSTLETPEGFASFIFEKQRSCGDAFNDAVSAELERLAFMHIRAAEDDAVAQSDEPQ